MLSPDFVPLTVFGEGRSGERADEASPAGDGVTVRMTEAAALDNLRAVLQQLCRRRLRCSEKTSRPSAATVGVVAAALVDGDFSDREPIAAYASPLLLRAGGLAELAGGRLQLTGRGRAASRGLLRRPSGGCGLDGSAMA